MKTLLLLSGGIDSPVAGYILKKKGIEVACIHFSMEPIVDQTSELKSRKIAEKLGFSPFYVVPFGKTLEEIAKKLGYDTISTGENLGQVGSQTLDNMAVTDRATDLVVLRPILCNDKTETIKIAEQIG